jgi:hypothetical protein
MVSTSSEQRALGDRLKRHRERRGVTLESISKSTKVATALFAGLERGDCSRWPAGIYSRAYVRAYADAVGLNGEEIVDDFVSAFGSLQGNEGGPTTSFRPAGTLRMTIAEDPTIDPTRVLKRLALTATDLFLSSGLAWTAHALFDTSLLITVGSVVAYHATGRLISDDPLPWWAVRRVRAAAVRRAAGQPTEEVAVGDAASTTA